MANVDQYLQQIMDAVYGEEVRGSIHDAIEAMNVESTNAESVAISSRDSALNYANAAEQSKIDAQTAQSAAETAQTAAETAQMAAETAQSGAETAESNANIYMGRAEAAQSAAETAQTAAETAQMAAETAQGLSEDAKDDAETAKALAEAAQTAANAAKVAAQAAQAAAEAAQAASERILSDLGYPIDPKGPILFSQLPTSGMRYGWMYQITEEFTTDNRFIEGPGVVFPENAEVYYTSDDLWAVMGGTSVTGVKGGAEQNYRQGQVNITATNIGLGNVNNTSDADKPISTAQQNALNLKANVADLAAVAMSGSYEDLDDKPEHLGHSIKDTTTTYTDRPGLQFVGEVSVTDDAQGDKTIIEIYGGKNKTYSSVSEMEADINNVTEGEDLYIPDADGVIVADARNIIYKQSSTVEEVLTLIMCNNSTPGTYTLQCVVDSSGNKTYSWV